MSQPLRRQTAAEQTAAHLREGIRAGRWVGKLPGVLALATECDVSPATMRAAVRMLERDGWIRGAGAGRARTVGVPEEPAKEVSDSLRVTILPGMRLTDEDGAFQKVVMRLQNEIEQAGHLCRIALKSQEDLGHDVERIGRFVQTHPSDAWVIIGSKRAVVAWFAAQAFPTICIGGEVLKQRIAGTGMITIGMFEKVVQHLVGLGHRRIVFLWPDYRADDEGDHPYIGALGRALAEVGTRMTNYHVPIWPTTPEGLRTALDKVFQFTPPTAIITTYGKWMAGVLSYLAARGLRAPRDISLFSLNEDDWFAWKEPRISCLSGDDFQMVRRIVRWVDAIPRGKADRKFVGFPMRWIQGGSIGPAKG